MNLSSVFTEVAYKRLVTVDLPNSGSNQHELNGVTNLRDFFGTTEKIKGSLSWHYFADDKELTKEDGSFTFYDARAKSSDRTGRTEWRFYYEGEFLRHAKVNDWFFLARANSGLLYALIFQDDSAWLRAAKVLFGVDQITDSFDPIPKHNLDVHHLQLLCNQIIGELDLDVTIPFTSTDEELMLSTFDRTFPKTKEMSAFARTQVEVDINKADKTLIQWLEREEQLFRALENVIIRERLTQNFSTVDEFIAYSLSVQNRRKSRMGFALQNHLAELFTQRRLNYTAQAHTEGNNQPDFIFPSETEYHNKAFDPSLLVMLGAKSTSKDRWRQVLTEADRIPLKHLCTLEAGISTKQTDEMHRQNLVLVVPEGLHETYSTNQQKTLLTLEDFIGYVRGKQIKNK